MSDPFFLVVNQCCAESVAGHTGALLAVSPNGLDRMVNPDVALDAHQRFETGRVYRHLTAVPADAETAEERSWAAKQRQAQRKRELRAALRGGAQAESSGRDPISGRFRKVAA